MRTHIAALTAVTALIALAPAARAAAPPLTERSSRITSDAFYVPPNGFADTAPGTIDRAVKNYCAHGTPITYIRDRLSNHIT